MSVIPSLKPLSDKRPVGPTNDRLPDSRTTVGPGRRERGATRQTLRRHVGPKGKRRLDGEKLLAVGYWVPTYGES